MTRALVTGGLGFIGTHLCRRLLIDRPDLDLTVVDDLSGTLTDWSDLVERCTIVIDDLRAVGPTDPRLRGEPFDEIWHLASPVGSLGILDRAGCIAGDIIDLAAHAHDLAAAWGASLLYVSSSEVYGRDGRHDETTELIVPDRRGARMEYALGKLTAEHILANRSVDRGVRLTIVRPFNCSGPGQSCELGFVVPTFVRAAQAGDPLPVHGDGSARRAFCHVDDLVEGLIAVHHRGRSGRVYNVGQADGATSILALAERVIRRLGSTSTIHHVDPRARHGHHWLEAFDKIPDTTRVEADTDWRAMLTLDRIIDDVAAHRPLVRS